MVTVAIPVFNGEQFMADTIQSIVYQSYPVDKIIISDDASIDGTKKLVNKLMKKYPQHSIQYFCNKKNLGYPFNWNRCFEYCTTKYLIILHQDDNLKPHAVKILYNYLITNQDLALAGGNEDFIDSSGNIVVAQGFKPTKVYKKGQVFEFVVHHGSYIPCSSVMFDMEKIRTTGYFDTDVIATDELFWPKVLINYPIAILGQSLIFRRIHDKQTEYRHFVEYEKKAFTIYKKFLRIVSYENRIDKKHKLVKFLKIKFSRGWIEAIAPNVAKQGYRIIALKYIWKAVILYPPIILHFPKLWKSFAKVFVYLIGFNSQR
ncbi:MAG: glycosyltransferase family 2 protein [Marinilabiliaceae bacterium]|nr:glycosyltransferase family 2 protein [Marinilabiliaceae bacterium]